MAHELMKGYNIKQIAPSCTIQIDLQKAYDVVGWSAIETIMREMSFPSQIYKVDYDLYEH